MGSRVGLMRQIQGRCGGKGRFGRNTRGTKIQEGEDRTVTCHDRYTAAGCCIFSLITDMLKKPVCKSVTQAYLTWQV